MALFTKELLDIMTMMADDVKQLFGIKEGKFSITELPDTHIHYMDEDTRPLIIEWEDVVIPINSRNMNTRSHYKDDVLIGLEISF